MEHLRARLGFMSPPFSFCAPHTLSHLDLFRPWPTTQRVQISREEVMEYLRARLGFMAPVFAFFAALLMCRRLSTEAPGTVAPEPRDTESPLGKADEEEERGDKQEQEEEEEGWGEREGGTWGANGVAGGAGVRSCGEQLRQGDGAREGGERLRQSSYREGDGVAGGTMQAPRVLSMGTGSMSAAHGLGAAGTVAGLASGRQGVGAKVEGGAQVGWDAERGANVGGDAKGGGDVQIGGGAMADGLPGLNAAAGPLLPAALQLTQTDEGLMTPITGEVVKSGVEGGVGSGVKSGVAFPHPQADLLGAAPAAPATSSLAPEPRDPFPRPALTQLSAPSASQPGSPQPTPSAPSTSHPGPLATLAPSPSHPETLAPLAPSPSHPESLATLAPSPSHPESLAVSSPAPSSLAPSVRLAPSSSHEGVEPLAPSPSHPAPLAPQPSHPAPLVPSPSQHRLPPPPPAPPSRLVPEAVRSASFLSPSPKPGSPAGSAAERPAD